MTHWPLANIEIKGRGESFILAALAGCWWRGTGRGGEWGNEVQGIGRAERRGGGVGGVGVPPPPTPLPPPPIPLPPRPLGALDCEDVDANAAWRFRLPLFGKLATQNLCSVCRSAQVPVTPYARIQARADGVLLIPKILHRFLQTGRRPHSPLILILVLWQSKQGVRE